MPFKLGQFQNLARETRAERNILVRGKKWQSEKDEVYALARFKHLTVGQFPEIDFVQVELVPLLGCNRSTGAVNREISVASAYDNFNQFCLLIDKKLGKCRFGPSGFPGLEYTIQSYGFGPYLFSQLVAYGQKHYPKFAISAEHLDLELANFNRTLMNVFCRLHSFEIFSHDEDNVSVLAKRMELLTPYNNPKRVEELPLEVPEHLTSPTVDPQGLCDLLAEELL